MEFDNLADVMRRHLLTVMDKADFDISPGEAEGSWDIATDHWTIHVEGGSGFLAIDDEPTNAAEFTAARRAVMSQPVERALAAADQELGGLLSDALSRSGDAFTLDFVAALAQARQET